MSERFRALQLDQADGRTTAAVVELAEDELMPGEVTVDVTWSGLNYKDALAITGKGPIVRTFPFVPGIDFAGMVRSSADPRYQPGQPVLLTGWGVGERHFGGLAERARVKADWLVPMPHGLDAQSAMTLGTAGFTAALCVLELEREQVRPDSGEVVVTGAAGGVGAIATALLAKAGFKVVASTGRTAEHAWLAALGAAEIVDRSPFVPGAKGPLDKGRFAGAVDTVGGATLAGLLKTMAPGGTVTAVGNAGGVELTTSVFPFILRGVKLVGVDSVTVPYERRVRAWKRLAADLDPELLASIATGIGLAEVPEAAERLVQGQVRGRIIVDLGR